jgi:O-methyltransferase domain
VAIVLGTTSVITTDLAPLGRIVQQTISQFELEHRVKFLAGDFIQQDIPAADVIVMCIILHDFNLSIKKLLIRKAFAALPDHGVFVIIDTIIDNDRRSNMFGLCLSVHMLLEFGVDGGFDYTADDVTEWCREAGFSRVDNVSLGSSHSMALAYKHSSSRSERFTRNDNRRTRGQYPLQPWNKME